ncbi:putative PAS/PAC sensor signal transduction histidine kinase [Magnetofaba australis IT-1]|uniref:histidine kinase n=1 Tax=Magnetofaba australis IT-1 TaxID=1434232 RepID=A0A1Y2K9E9_9PROT|nr:putative PAS/PAC sensor signal transduction histidine kinase [Magnetofaba australis IT-1]
MIQKMDAAYADLVRYQVELEQKNNALNEANRFIASVLTAMTDVLIVCDPHGRIQEVNQALVNLTGRDQAWLLKQSVRELLQTDLPNLENRFSDLLDHKRVIDCEVSITAADDSQAPLAMNCSPRTDNKGRVVGLVLIGRPVGELRRAYDNLHRAHSELKQTQNQLMHAEKMASLGRVVAGVAHELNNPISFVFGNMHALKRYGGRIERYLQADQSPEQLQALRKELKIDRILADLPPLIEGALEGAERVSAIVQDLCGYSGGQHEPPRPYPLHETIANAVQWVTSGRADKPEVIYQLPETERHIVGRKGHVHQILVNLAQNAVDVMEGQTHRRLTIACDYSDQSATITVSDSGAGIDEAHLKQLFDPFFTTKPVGKGTGLGLYISYGLAQEQGGQLSAHNNPEGGASFVLTLPIAGAPQPGEPRP